MSYINVNIQNVEIFSVSMPLKSRIKMAGVILDTADNLIIKISGDNGLIGWGEASSAPTMTGEFVEGMVSAAKFLKSMVVGSDIKNLADIKVLLNTPLYGNEGTISAIEMAMLDLFARTNNCSLIELLGGPKRDSSRALYMIAGGTIDEEIARAKEKQKEGFDAFKIKVGSNSAKEDLLRCSSIRKALGNTAFISADANEGFNLTEAKTFASEAGESGIDFFEQPVPADDISDIKDVASSTSVPLGADEGVHSLADISELVAASAVKGCSLKTIKLGGIVAVLEAARHAHALGLNINLAGKVAETSISGNAVSILSCLVPNINWDVSITNQYLDVDPVSESLTIDKGRVRAPTGLGLGTEVDLDILKPFIKSHYS